MLSSHLFDKRVQACVKTSKLIQIIQSQLGEVIRRPLIACWWFFVCKRDERLKSKYNHSVSYSVSHSVISVKGVSNPFVEEHIV